MPDKLINKDEDYWPSILTISATRLKCREPINSIKGLFDYDLMLSDYNTKKRTELHKQIYGKSSFFSDLINDTFFTLSDYSTIIVASSFNYLRMNYKELRKNLDA